MTLFLDDGDVQLYEGDCITVMQGLADCSVDAVVCDPPYGLEFMGKAWDSFKPSGAHAEARTRRAAEVTPTGQAHSTSAGPYAAGRPFQAWCEAWAREALRVLKPGGHLLAFGGTRTAHRLAAGIEDAGFEIRDTLCWLYGSGFPKSLDVSKAIDKAAGATREVIGERADFIGKKAAEARRGVDNARKFNEAHSERRDASRGGYTDPASVGVITAPATEDAARWQGWGTALKPSHEPVILARKPVQPSDILALIGSHLDRLEAEWRAQEAEQTTRTGEADDSLAATDTSPSASTVPTSSSIVSSWRECWAAICEATSTSTTATDGATTTDLRILNSSLSQITLATITEAQTSPDGRRSNVGAADDLFGSVALRSRAILALSATEPATGSTHTSRPDGVAPNGFSPAYEPVILARKPLSGTVAANVLAHGTGALNIDASRIEHDGRGVWGDHGQHPERHEREPGSDGTTMGTGWHRPGSSRHAAGRWPANVLLDEEAARQLDAEAGERGGGPGRHTRGGGASGEWNPTDREAHRGQTIRGGGEPVGYGDRGGASRFFYTAKSSRSERNHGLHESQNGHPTVKPVALMRWLIRLATPPLVYACPLCQSEGDEDNGESEATARPMPSVRRDVHGGTATEQAPGVLQSAVLAGSDSSLMAAPDGDYEGVRPDPGGGQSDGDEGGLRDGASPSDGPRAWQDAGSGRGRPSPEWDQGRQPAGELGADAEAPPRSEAEEAAAGDGMSMLRGTDRRAESEGERRCGRCGSRLVERPGLVLDPFVGSGSTAVAARAEGFRCIGIDQDAEYLGIAAGRLSQLSLFADGVEAD